MHRRCVATNGKDSDKETESSNVQQVCSHYKMGVLFQLRFRTLAVSTVLLPLLSFVFCVLWSITYNFWESTSTHCRVTNYLPSISAAIGGYTPQRYVWRIGIAIHTAPRFLIAAMYYSYYSNLLIQELFWQRLIFIACFLHATEITSLVGLTYISSTENFSIHEKMFVSFMVCALSNMLLLCLSPRYGSKHQLTRLERKSLKTKSICGTINIVSFAMAIYFYFRHNWYCEPGMYTLFAFCEYVVVLTNMGFHMTAYWDFSDQTLAISSF